MKQKPNERYLWALLLLIISISIAPLMMAQTPLQTLITDQTPLALSNNFGRPGASTINSNGDYAFSSGTAIFYRPAGAPAAMRVMQSGDEVPGFTDSRLDLISGSPFLNDDGLLAFRVDFSQFDGTPQGAILTFDGSTLTKIVGGNEMAPGGNGASYGRSLTLMGLSTSGDEGDEDELAEIAFTAPLPTGTTLYIKPLGRPAVRVAGVGDSAPGTAGTLVTITPLSLFSTTFYGVIEILFTSNINGGSGGQGLFVANRFDGVRKVVANGDPNPLGGSFTSVTQGILGSHGVAFMADGGIWVTDNSGVKARKVAVGDVVTIPFQGTFPITSISALLAFNGGAIAFFAQTSGASGPLFRYYLDSIIERVSYAGQPVPGLPDETFNGFGAVSMSGDGVISFRGRASGGSFGIYQQAPLGGPLLTIARDGQAVPVAGGGTYRIESTTTTSTLLNGNVFFFTDVADGAADSAQLLGSETSTTVLLSTGDVLPSGARILLRTFKANAAGNFVGIVAHRPGGYRSLLVHNIATSTTSVLVTEGSTAPGTSGGRFRFFNNINSVFVGGAGSIAFSATISGGSAPSTVAIFTASPSQGISKIAMNDDEFPGGTVSQITSLAGFGIFPINDSGQIVFSANVSPGSIRTILRWSPLDGLEKVAAVGDTTSAGSTITAIAAGSDFTINSGGKVAFRANTSAHTGSPGLYVGSVGNLPAKVVAPGDPGPGGSTFLGFSLAAFNDNDQLAFKASLNGGPGGGIFVGSPSETPLAIALAGEATPGGGIYDLASGTTADALINNQEDVVFRSNIAGGTSNSGYFIRRGPSGPVLAIALQGQAAPGTTGVFDTFTASFNNILGELFQLGEQGDISFNASFLSPGARRGLWHVSSDNRVVPMVIRGESRPELAGGRPVVFSQTSTWGGGKRHFFWLRFSGTSAFDSIAMYDGNSALECSPTPLTFGQAVNGLLDASSCLMAGNRTDVHSFEGNSGQQISVAVESEQFFSKIELLDPLGTVMATAGGGDVVRTSRLPAEGYFTLPSTGTYTIRAIASFGGGGSYTISIFEAPVLACIYSLSPLQSSVSPEGGTHFFDVLTQPGCSPASIPSPDGSFYFNAVYSGGRVTFEVAENTGGARQDTITVAGQTHTINQFGVAPPANDGFGSAQVLTGSDSPAENPVTGYNTTATTDSGEPSASGNTPAKSVWYSWTAPGSGLYSFSTSGSSFDTVMAIYACPSSGECTFTNLNPVGSNDDTTFFDKTSKVNFRATEGTEYRIVVDGKDGASGTIELSWRQYDRLFRLYLQNYNGNQTTIAPDNITASNGSNTVIPTLVSMGVYEFNLPADNTTYSVTITGPEGIVWDPNNFPLDTSTLLLDELMQGPSSVGQNSVSNAQNQTPRYIYGFIKQITLQEVTGLSVMIGSSRGPNPRDPAPCSPLAFTTINSVPYATYQCLSQPQALHDIVPRRTGKKFTISVLSFNTPVNTTYNGTPGNSFLATNVQTYNITGQVLAGGAGTVVDLAFTPEGLNAEIALRTVTGADGSFSFPDLPANTYKLKASREGIVFIQPNPIDLQSDQAVNISAQMLCTYTPAELTPNPGTGGPGKFTINTNDPTCAWQATSEAPWIVVNSGVGVGSGPVHFTVLTNDGLARTGGISISGLAEAVPIQQNSNIPAFATVSGKVFTPNGLALRNALVSITDSLGNRRTTQSSTLGFYSFDNVATVENHVIRVSSKRYRFQSRTVNLTGNLADVDFVGLE